MKTLTSHLRLLLTAIFVVLLLAFAGAAQTGDLQATSAETPPAIQGAYTFNFGTLPRRENLNTSGDNTAFSTKSLFNISRSQVPGGNYFAGVYAGDKNTGSWNSFVGSYTGYYNTEGSSNSFFGSSAGYNSQAGNHNSFFGFSAGYHNTGNSNSFLGSNAGYYNIGSNNSFLGSNAGSSNQSGSNNSFLGFSAGSRNESGSNNLFLGSRAGYGNKTGSNNTVIGTSADVSSDNLIFATAIGAGSVVRTRDTIVLGRNPLPGLGLPLDTVLIPGRLQLNTLPKGPGVALCRSNSPTLLNQIVSCSSSSLRYKKNIKSFSSGLELLQRLRPIRFEWKDGGTKDIGFGAEDVAAVEPLLVTYNEKGEVEGVKYDRISTVLVNAIKEQQEQLRQQQIVIEGLKKLLCGQNPAAEVCKQ